MKLRSLRIETSPRLMIIPMIDVVFFLLVFFMISTLYMVEQNVLPVLLPQASTAQTSADRQVPLTLTVDGAVLIYREAVPRELLARRIAAETARDPQTAFVLRADRRVSYGQVVELLDDLKKAGVSRLTVAIDPTP